MQVFTVFCRGCCHHKNPCRRTFVILFSTVVLFLLLVLGTVLVIDQQHRIAWNSMFPEDLPALNFDPDMNGPEILMNDPLLVTYLRDRYLVPPSSRLMSQYTDESWTPLQLQDAKRITTLLGDKRRGFFVDCGDNNDSIPTTLAMERNYQWTGLVIEANPHYFDKLVSLKRRAFLSHSCLSNRPYPTAVSYLQNEDGEGGEITDWPVGGSHPHHVDLQCFPLLTYLLAVNASVVDFLNLNAGGEELGVLRALPWAEVDIKALAINIINKIQGDEVEKLMKHVGYEIYHKAMLYPGRDIYAQVPV